ncbi:hypothetical protein AD928_01020 [Acetobacter cerevisiae]|uniref:Uncharacterized protein n=1 Tax=Acetobacter cerevisiae TaxID=178900 RepID=A0A149QYG6_9PROT|nr:hypothetical protein AD928_01020 [Acetobacter cerevisiae]
MKISVFISIDLKKRVFYHLKMNAFPNRKILAISQPIRLEKTCDLHVPAKLPSFRMKHLPFIGLRLNND